MYNPTKKKIVLHVMVGDIVTNYIFDAGYTFGAHCNYWFAIGKLFPVENVLINFNLKFPKYVDLDFSENIFQIVSTEQPLSTRFFPVLYLFGAKSVWGNLKKRVFDDTSTIDKTFYDLLRTLKHMNMKLV